MDSSIICTWNVLEMSIYKTYRYQYIERIITLAGSAERGKYFRYYDGVKACLLGFHLDEEKRFFIVGDANVALDEYNGQPAIIWDDWEQKSFLFISLGETVFKMFDVRNRERGCLQ